MKHPKKILAGILGVLLVSILLAGCSDIFTPPGATDTNRTNFSAPVDNDLTRYDYLALLKTQDNHKTSVEELQGIVAGVLDKSPAGRSVISAESIITGVKKLPISAGRDFTVFNKGYGRSAVAEPETDPIEIYEFSIGETDSDNEAFVLASNDDRIGNVLAIADGSLSDANEEFLDVLNANLQDYIDATVDEYNSITEAEIEAALEKAIAEQIEGARLLSDHFSGVNLNGWTPTGQYSSDFAIQKNTLLATKWGPGSTGAYSSSGYAYNNYVKYHYGNNYYVTGCGPTAMAQIIAYHNYIKPSAPNKPAAFNIANVGQWSGTYNLALIRNMEKITNASSSAAKGQVAALMYQLGKNTDALYNYKGTGETYVESMSNIRNGFISIGYTVTNYGTATGLVETPNSSTIAYYTSPAVLKDALNNNRPIFVRGGTVNNTLGHFWVIDGYGSMTTYREYFSNSQGQIGYVLFTLSNCLMVHCNLGWNGNADGWYVYGIFDTGSRTLLEKSNNGNGANYSTNTWVLIPKKP